MSPSITTPVRFVSFHDVLSEQKRGIYLPVVPGAIASV